ncbi:hypothetical protein VTL71DRAFT_1033 [Oculimacula yallundae]|uniref:Uncharacterized protein n=1 Tax=Oculimacula yallundae TaxID=86028 RepID=A0ABR4D1Q6_9HELO
MLPIVALYPTLAVLFRNFFQQTEQSRLIFQTFPKCKYNKKILQRHERKFSLSVKQVLGMDNRKKKSKLYVVCE